MRASVPLHEHLSRGTTLCAEPFPSTLLREDDAKPFARPSPRKGKNLRGRDLRGASLVDMSLQGADFEEADLREADLRGADLFGARFRRTDLRGTHFDMTRVLEIWVPPNLPIEIVNQIRHFDFRHVTRREVPECLTDANLPCPYRTATLRPVLYEWGSRTWRGGARWCAPGSTWTLEEIVGAVLTTLGCRHDLAVPDGIRSGHRRR